MLLIDKNNGTIFAYYLKISNKKEENDLTI